MKCYVVQCLANGHWTAVAVYHTKQDAIAYAKAAIPEYAARIIEQTRFNGRVARNQYQRVFYRP